VIATSSILVGPIVSLDMASKAGFVPRGVYLPGLEDTQKERGLSSVHSYSVQVVHKSGISRKMKWAGKGLENFEWAQWKEYSCHIHPEITVLLSEKNEDMGKV
jgi:hypothetical protein